MRKKNILLNSYSFGNDKIGYFCLYYTNYRN